ncbi:MAG: site-specific integrase [Longimicrobiales bacterium]|nr:site-specific integrase [Longimicrobiales bacterium]
MAAWSYVAGKPSRHGSPSSQVRVFERPDREGLFLSRAWLRTESDAPQAEALPAGTTREEAELLAREVATRRERRILRGEDGTPSDLRRLTLAQLFGLYHASAKAQRWSQGHKRNRERSRAFWLAEYGPGFLAAQLTPGDVEDRAARAARAKGWAPATERRYLVHIGAATRYAVCKRRALAEDPLAGLDVPAAAPDTEGLDYTAEEARALATPAEGVDWRVTLAASIAADTGRRIGAIRFLRTEDVILRADGRLVLRFAAAHDKSGRTATVPVSSATAELVLAALERDRVQRWGWLLPGQRRGVPLGGMDATGSATWARMLHEAEKALGIPTVRGRAWHGIKRRHVTVSWEEAHGDAALVGDVTGNTSPEVLRRAYRRKSEARTAAQVDRIRARLEGAPGAWSHTWSHTTDNVTDKASS